MNVLLEEGSFVLEMDQPVQVNVEGEQPEQLQEDYEEDHFEISSFGPYRFLRNCSSAGVWMCAVYNLCVILLLISVYVYRRMK
ncbi:hypothetical protein KR067_003880 [Drosophila pandora]|nr:hypothetical protein KR067_003880 [Drosophila pandora]